MGSHNSTTEDHASRRGLRLLGILGSVVLLALGGVVAIASSGGASHFTRPRSSEAMTEALHAFVHRDFEKAESIVRSELKEGRDSTDNRIVFGRILAERGRLSEARDLFSSVLRDAPDSIDGILCLAEALRRLGFPDAALAQLNHATALCPNDPLIWKALGLVQQERGDLTGAMVSFQKSLSLDAKQEDVSELLSRLASSRQDVAGHPTARPGRPGLDLKLPRPPAPKPLLPNPFDQLPTPYRGNR